MYQLVERKVIAADAQSYSFASLSGDVDEVYYISANLIGGAGAIVGVLNVRPNAIATNQTASGVGADAGGVPYGDARTEMTIGYSPAAATSSASYGTLWAKTGAQRLMTSQTVVELAGVARSVSFGSRWNETTTAITSLLLRSTVATGIGIGSVLMLYKRAS
jgi:hypothetical protein